MQTVDLTQDDVLILKITPQVGPPGPVSAGNSLPGGRLTLVSGKSEMSADVTSSTLWYAPYNTDTFPVLDSGLAWQMVQFSSGPTDQIGASMAGGSRWAAGTSRDVFGLVDGTICTGPAWPASDDASRQLVRYNGVKVNSAALLCDLSATSSVTAPQYQATWLGSIHSSVAGQLTVHFGYGQNRKFEVWTAYAWNQVDIVLRVGDTSGMVQYNPANQYPAWQAFNNDPLNRGNPFTGAPTLVDVSYYQSAFINTKSGAGASGFIALVGWDGVGVGYYNKQSSDNTQMQDGVAGAARYSNSNSVGIHTATMLIAKANGLGTTVWGAAPSPWPFPNINQEMLVHYKG